MPIDKTKFFSCLIIVYIALSHSLPAQESSIIREHQELLKLTQAYAQYHERMKDFFSGEYSCLIKKGSFLSTVLTDVKKTTLNNENIGGTILKASWNQHNTYYLFFEKLQRQIETVDMNFLALTTLAKEMKTRAGASYIQNLLLKALPLNRSMPGTETLLRSDRVYKPNYDQNGQLLHLEEQSNLPVNPNLPQSWQQYMNEEVEDHHEYINTIVIALDKLRESVLRQKLNLVESTPSPSPISLESFEAVKDKYKGRLEPVINSAPALPFTSAKNTHEISSTNSRDEKVSTKESYIETVPLTHETSPQLLSSQLHQLSAKAFPPVLRESEESQCLETLSYQPPTPVPSASVVQVEMHPNLIASREKISKIERIRNKEFIKFFQALTEKGLTKIKENKHGLLIWFGKNEVHLFHRIHNRGFVMGDQDLKVANKALNNMGLRLENFIPQKDRRTSNKNLL